MIDNTHSHPQPKGNTHLAIDICEIQIRNGKCFLNQPEIQANCELKQFIQIAVDVLSADLARMNHSAPTEQ
jgi:hypothetical protein